MAGAVAVGAGVAGAEGRKLVVSDPQEAREALRSVLKDPDKTDKLIEAVTQDPAAENELANDPQVLVNLSKLTNSVERHLRRKDNGEKRWTWATQAGKGVDKLDMECPRDPSGGRL